MEKQIITRENLKQIHNVACDGWKTKLADYAKRNPFQLEIELTQTEVDEMFNASDASQTKVLKKFFSRPKDIRDKVKSFLDACSVLSINPNTVYSETDSIDDKAFKRLKIMIKALNEGWYPNWDDENEYKYMNYFKMKGGFSFWDTDIYSTTTFVPSALSLKNKDLALHMIEIALEDYKEYYS